MSRHGLGVYVLFSTAMILAIFARAYEPGGDRRVSGPDERHVSVRFVPSTADDALRSRRVVVPVKTHTDDTAPLNRPTQFVSEQENPFSGSTTDTPDTMQWVQPDAQPADADAARNPRVSDMPAAPGTSEALQRHEEAGGGMVPVMEFPEPADTKNPSAEENPVREADRVAAFSSSDLHIFEERMRTLQELPNASSINSRLLVHFSNDGEVRLGTEAQRHADYFFNMVREISKAWQLYFPVMQHYYGFLKEGEILVVFELDLDGELSSIEVAESYGQHILDRACVSAVREAAGFGPIPREFREKGSMRVPFLFVYRRPEKPVPMYR